jgi:hypothetical protein
MARRHLSQSSLAPAAMSGPYGVLRASVVAVPAMRYALGVAGLAGSASLALGFFGTPEAAIIGAAASLGGSFLLLVFAKLAREKPKTFRRPALVVMWTTTVLFSLSLVLLLTSFFFDRPLHLRLVGPPSHADAQYGHPQEILGGVRIAERRTTLDLSGWKSVSEDDVARSIKRSRAVSRNHFVIERLEPEQGVFVHRMGTSSPIEPEVHCDKCKVEQVIKAVAPAPKEWDIIFDISREPVGPLIDIDFSVDFWNAFDSPDQWWGGFRILYATERAIFRVEFPKEHRPAGKTVTFGYIKANTRRRELLQPNAEDANVQSNPDGTVSSVMWTVQNPQPDRSYRVFWSW